MEKDITYKSKNSDFLELMINDIFFSKNSLNERSTKINPFFSYFEK